MSDSSHTTEVLATDSIEAFANAVSRAASALRAGKLVAVPTETVYGLAANAFNAEAVAAIFRVKQRPAHNPLIVHVAGLAMAQQCVRQWPSVADQLAAAFWPGPLTMVLPRAGTIPDIVTAGGSTVAIRWPRHAFMQALLDQCGFPLAAPSANPANAVSPTEAAHVREDLGNQIELIVDGGSSHVGIESTVVDVSGEPVRILRPGMIDSSAIAAIGVATAQLPFEVGREGGDPWKSPGQGTRHYSPRTPLLVLAWADEEELAARIDPAIPRSAVQIIAHTRVPSGEGWAGVNVVPHDAAAFARALYAVLRRCDASGARLIVIEAVPSTAEWQGISDRLRRAAG